MRNILKEKVVDSFEAFLVRQPGSMTTVQDQGRHFHQWLGMPVSGVLDHYAYRLGNMLLGQKEDSACLEITFFGPELEVLNSTDIAITGADVSPKLNGNSFPMWTMISVQPGDILSFSTPQSGCRAYMCVNGGIAVNKVMGSRSTNVRLNIGGYEGRRLMAGDRLRIYQSIKKSSVKRGIKLPKELIPRYGSKAVARVVLGPQCNYFAENDGLKTFLESEFQISPESNREGFRLIGPDIKIRDDMPESIPSEAFPPGGIQVRPNGQPLVMMNDLGGGGYAKIAVIISIDLPKIVQLVPGNTVMFKSVKLHEAHQLIKEEHNRLNRLFSDI